MAQTELLHGLCPKCGEALDVPAHLKQFSCMYCGARLTPVDLASEAAEPAAPAADDVDGQACAAFYRDHILETVTKHKGIEREVTRNTYEDAFTRYRNSCAVIFRQLDQAVSAGAITLDEAVEYYLDALENRWETEKSWTESATSILERDKFIIAIYLVPMLREMMLPISEPYCKLLNERWIGRYPKRPFYLGTYEDMTAGFKKKFFGLCFITTAVCRSSGKPDDCAELTAFRQFRDGYLRACPDGPGLIEEYYNIAPGIVLHLELSEDRDAKYAALREQYLEPCYADLQAGRLSACKERYTSMVRALEKEYLLQ